jgi:hypothetical protein
MIVRLMCADFESAGLGFPVFVHVEGAPAGANISAQIYDGQTKVATCAFATASGTGDGAATVTLTGPGLHPLGATFADQVHTVYPPGFTTVTIV